MRSARPHAYRGYKGSICIYDSPDNVGGSLGMGNSSLTNP
jgi:hypothetical protein